MSNSSTRSEPVATVIGGHTFTIDTRYVLKESRILGKGSFGVVCTAYDAVRKIDLAIKRIRPYANDEWDARHTLREIRLLKLLGPHPNIISLYELSLFETKTELYMAMEVMDCDLHRVIQSKQPLSEKHHKCFIKQILEGIKAMHAIGVFHRDLKPGNILVSKDCQLRITDFGLARFIDDKTRLGDNQLNPMTEYVVTRWYRPPELLLSPNRPYSEAIDLWSIGCILAELLRRKPLFPGKSHANQVSLIFEVMGYTTVSELGFPVSQEASSYLDKRCKFRKQPLSKVVPEASSSSLQLLESLLMVNPSDRPTADEALGFPFLVDAEVLHNYNVQYLTKPSKEFFEFEMEKFNVEKLREMIHKEVEISAADAYHFENQHAEVVVTMAAPPVIPFVSNDNKPNNNTNHHRTESDSDLARLSNNSATDTENFTEGPASQLPTQTRNGKDNNPFRSQTSNTMIKSNNTSNKSTRANSNNNMNEKVNNNNNNNNETNNSLSVKSIEESTSSKTVDSSTISSALINGGNILTAVRNEAGPIGSIKSSVKRTPKTPSPQKMDIILQKDLNNKKRFLLQGLAQQQHGSGPIYNSDAAALEVLQGRGSRGTFPQPQGNNPYQNQNGMKNNSAGLPNLGKGINQSNSTDSSEVVTARSDYSDGKSRSNSRQNGNGKPGLLSHLQVTYNNIANGIRSNSKGRNGMNNNNNSNNSNNNVNPNRPPMNNNSNNNMINGNINRSTAMMQNGSYVINHGNNNGYETRSAWNNAN
eukprot:gene7633-10391_t